MKDYDPEACVAIRCAPLPTPKLLKQRTNLFIQFLRFAAINIKMLRVIVASHHK